LLYLSLKQVFWIKHSVQFSS